MSKPAAPPVAAAGLTGGEAAVLHRAFRAVLVALAYPGRSVRVAPDGEAAVRLVLRSTWDAGCRVATAGSPVRLPWPAGPTAVQEAELLVVGGPCSHGAVAALPRGDEVHPERGATALFAVSGRAGAAWPVRLSGPGVRDVLDAELPLDPEEIEARAGVCARWPMGVDVLVIDGGGRLTGLPRTTRVERR